MRVILFGAALLVGLTASATAQNLSTEKLLNRWYESNSLCRGGAGGETYTWCKVRDGYVDLQIARNWCFGKKSQVEYQMEWHECGPGSNKPEIALPKPAAPQNPDQKAAEALEAAKRKIDCLLTQAQGVKVGRGCDEAKESPPFEFLFVPGRVISLADPSMQLAIGSKFQIDAIKQALPVYDVRFVSAKEQERTGDTLGAEGTAEFAFIVSKRGRELLHVFSHGLEPEELKDSPHLTSQNIIRIEAVEGVIDASGSTIGSPLKRAFPPDGRVGCTAHEAGACWSLALPQIGYVPGGGDECDFSWLESGAPEVSAAQIPDCVQIGGITLGG